MWKKISKLGGFLHRESAALCFQHQPIPPENREHVRNIGRQAVTDVFFQTIVHQAMIVRSATAFHETKPVFARFKE
jgi:hypothetical protein